ncbi:MAG TPA: ricin-type beta-trefoil lectin domain protein [Streptosporangiaceae bacterium]|nr:ricin-type beta-trefoil lectin domain protein [Streptosporangiaceae bacterium]
MSMNAQGGPQRPRWTRSLLLGVTAILTIVSGLALAPAQLATAQATTTITVNGAQGGRVFNGIGAISGGGGNTVLLTSYPPAQQQAILDYLFKPDYGASLDILKVEIGGDTNSTDGSESSIEHAAGSVDCSSGYEWWLMEQAKALNPAIKLYGLAWGAPGWVGNTFWTTNTINYLVSWLNCAKSHGLTINYLGGWNERGYVASWYVALRQALNTAGFTTTKVVAADSDWTVANAMATNAGFRKAVAIVGAHYPCTGGDGGPETTCDSTTTAAGLGKPLWASENGSQDYNTGAVAMARADNRDYIDGKMTSTINWPIIASVYPSLPYATDGLAVADQPWSGAYSVGEQAWVTAQTTQFVHPGWTYIDSASGYLQGNRSDGSYVTLKSPNGKDWSSVIETMDATAPQDVTYNVSGGLSTGTVHVWSTNVDSTSPSAWFVHSTDITPSNGSFSLTLQPGYVYSVTTTTGQHKGTAASPAQGWLPLPYSDSFSTDTVGQQPPYFAQQQGSFQVEPCAGGRAGNCLTQQAPQLPVEWDNGGNPYTIGGGLGWTNYTVSADALLEQPGAVQLMGRVGQQQAFNPADINCYYLQVSDTGAWSVVRNSTSGQLTTLASGTVSALGTGTWHRLSMTFNGNSISAAIDGTTVAAVTDTSYVAGMAGLGVDGYQTDQFSNLSVTPAGSQTNTGPVIAGDATSSCVDDRGSGTTDGTIVEMWTCNSGANQQWTIEGNGTIQVFGKCLDIVGGGTANGTLVDLWTCNSGANQQWVAANGTLVNPVSGQCLDDPGFNTGNGTQLDIWACNGGTNQQWALP